MKELNKIISVNFKKVNLTLLLFTLVLFSYYIYQTISVSSGNVVLINLKKEFLERKNNLNGLANQYKNRGNFDADLIKETLGMTEIERFDYFIIGPSEFVLIQESPNNTQ